jgi:RNA polymerase sigma-70 factor (family 1)
MKLKNQNSNEELVALLKQGDAAAFNELYERFWEILFDRAYNFLHDKQTAQDCVQDIFIWLWEHRSTVKIENVQHYLLQAVRFQCIKVIRDNKATKIFEERLLRTTGTILQDDTLQYKEIKMLLQQLLNKLPSDKREIFLMNREEGLTYKQIAELKAVSVKTVEKKMSIVLKELRSVTGTLFLFFLFCW